VRTEADFYVPTPFDRLYGLQFDEVTPELVRAHVAVTPEILQPFGLVHGGVYAAIAESTASHGTGLGILNAGKVASGLANQTSFLRPITAGTIHARALRRHAGRTTWIWDVELSDDAGHICVLTRMTMAVRDPR
jgi:1,4-dihydroxy-2-naphthoyl-CoA hydrolase